MKTIIAIGGGDIKKGTTKAIDEFIINYTHKMNPKVLFIPTASKDNEDYIQRFITYYESLQATVDVLLLSAMTNEQLIRSKIFASDIIYIGGGNTQRMLRIFKRHSLGKLLQTAYEKGIVLCGLSAGCACFFNACYSDCNRCTDPTTPLTYLPCLNFLPYINCPHYNDPQRQSFDDWVKQYAIDGIAIEDDVAICFENGHISQLIRSDQQRNAYLFHNGSKELIN